MTEIGPRVEGLGWVSGLRPGAEGLRLGLGVGGFGLQVREFRGST